MNSLNKIVYDILEIIKSHQISDDSDIDERQIIFHINTQRSLIIREILKNGGRIDVQIEQDLGCLNLIEVDAGECCDIDTDCFVLRTKDKLPQFIETDGNNGITRVGPVKKLDIPFSYVPYQQFTYSGEGKYNSKVLTATLLNGYIYVKCKDPAYLLLDKINVRGVLDDPQDAARFIKCDGSRCYSNDDQYPIYGWTIPIIKDRIFKQLGISLQIPKDTSNDAKDDIDANNRT